MKTAHAKFQKGFTLIELLVVIGILAVLLAITLIAINPARQFEQANNTQRSSDVNAILNAVWQFAVEENGDLTDLGIPATLTNIGTGVGEVNLCPNVAPTFIAALPLDPQTGTAGTVDADADGCPDTYDTQYSIMQTPAGRVTVTAPNTEPVDADATNDITVTR